MPAYLRTNVAGQGTAHTSGRPAAIAASTGERGVASRLSDEAVALLHRPATDGVAVAQHSPQRTRAPEARPMARKVPPDVVGATIAFSRPLGSARRITLVTAGVTGSTRLDLRREG